MPIYGSITWLPVFLALSAYLMQTSWKYGSRWIGLLISLTILFGSLWIELGGTTLFGYLRGVQSEPSIATALFFLLYCIKSSSMYGALETEKNFLLICVLVLGFCLYPLALGLVGYFDPYALGYHPYFSLGILLLALPAWWLPRTRTVAVWLIAALSAQGYELGESDNLWDYLLDPIIFFIGLGWLMRYAWRRRHEFGERA